MTKISLNQDWRFLQAESIHGKFWREVPETAWRTVDLPHDWSIETERSPSNPSGQSNGWFGMGRGFYRKTFHAPAAWLGKQVSVEFEGVYMNAEVKLNEHYLGRHPYGYTGFTFDLTPYLRFGTPHLPPTSDDPTLLELDNDAPNTLEVRVDNSGQLNSRWYSGSGIYRPAWLIVKELVHVAHWGLGVTTPEVTEKSATVKLSVKVENHIPTAKAVTLRARIIDPAGQPAGYAEVLGEVPAQSDHEFSLSVQVAQPRLWSPETPALYRVETEVWVEGKVWDTADTTFGIRSLAWSAADGLLLNGKSIKMKGGCVHHDNGVMGAASFPRAEERKVALLRASGFDAIRCAHNPPAPAFLDACDRLGMLVIDETFDCWREGKNPFDYHLSFDDWWQRDTTSMVMRDRNHPSVIIWSIGNEVAERDGRSNGAYVARMQADLVRSLDPTRPVTSAINGVHSAGTSVSTGPRIHGTERTWKDTEHVFSALDIGGYNYQWQVYRTDHESWPYRIMMGTETFPLEAYDNWMRVLELPYVVGDFVWTSNDYLGESGIGRVYYEEEMTGFLGDYPWHQAFCGDIDIAGFKRPQSYYRDVLWGSGEKMYLAIHTPIAEGLIETVTRWGWPDVANHWTWPGSEGKTLKVDVYTAFEQVELLLNGRSLGTQTLTPANKLIASFEVPYEPGELKAVGYADGAPVGQTVLQTVGPAAALRLSPDRSEIATVGESGIPDLSYVTVEVVDAQGRRQPNAANPIYFTVQGAGAIAAVGSGNPTSTERYTGNQRQAYQGRCVVVVKSAAEAGEIRLRAQADGLDTAEVVIVAK